MTSDEPHAWCVAVGANKPAHVSFATQYSLYPVLVWNQKYAPSIDAKGVDSETPKASRESGKKRGYPPRMPPRQPTRGSRERRKLPAGPKLNFVKYQCHVFLGRKKSSLVAFRKILHHRSVLVEMSLIRLNVSNYLE